MLRRIVASLKYRAKWARLGVYYIRSLRLNTLRIGGRRFALRFPDSEQAVQEYELGRIVFDDCYGLSEVAGEVRTVLDIGANHALFAIAARHHFPKAIIHCYEPNPKLEPYLTAHCGPMRATVHMAAVGRSAGRIDLVAGANSLHSVSKESAAGEVQQVAFSEAVSKLGSVDVLKLDCEGAEWELFQDRSTWERIRVLVMEYHLWAKPDSTVKSLERELRGLGFTKIAISPDAAGNPWGFARCAR